MNKKLQITAATGLSGRKPAILDFPVHGFDHRQKTSNYGGNDSAEQKLTKCQVLREVEPQIYFGKFAVRIPLSNTYLFINNFGGNGTERA